VKRLLRLTALAATIAAALYAPSAAAPAVIDSGGPGQTTGPACADVTDGGVVNPDANPLETLQFAIFTVKPSCEDVNYTVTVTYHTATGFATNSVTVQGNRYVDPNSGPLLIASIPLPGNTGTDVCVSVSTSDKKGRVFDNAPDEGCASFLTTPEGSPSLGFH
jgi:hypothetical protein